MYFFYSILKLLAARPPKEKLLAANTFFKLGKLGYLFVIFLC